MKKIDNMENFAELFMAIYALERDEHNEIFFSRDIKYASSIVLNNELNKSKMDHNLFDNEGNFRIGDFINEINFTELKKYVSDNYMYNFYKNMIVTEVDDKKTLKKLEKYDYSDIIFVNDLVNNVIRIDELLKNERIKSDENNEQMNEFTKIFLTIYSTYYRYDEDGKIILPKGFAQIVNYVMNNSCKAEINERFNGLYDEITDNFKIESFLKSVKDSKIKSYWADAWEYDLSSDNIFSSINKDLVNYIYDNISEDDIDLVGDIVCNYDKVLSDIKKLRYM